MKHVTDLQAMMKHVTGNDETRHRQCPHFRWLYKTLKFAYLKTFQMSVAMFPFQKLRLVHSVLLCQVLLVFLPCVY